VTISPGTLGSSTALAAVTRIDSSLKQGFRVAKASFTGVFSGKTTAEGPVQFGYEIGMSAAEIKAYLEADPQKDQDDHFIRKGQYIKTLGVIGLADTAGALFGGIGRHWEDSPQWSISEDGFLSIWAYNWGAALTSGLSIDMNMCINGVWFRD